MKKTVKYSEPESYFPKSIRNKILKAAKEGQKPVKTAMKKK